VWGSLLGGPIDDPTTGQVIDGSGVGVAVVDTGIDTTPPDLDESVVRDYQVVDDELAWWATDELYQTTSTFVGDPVGSGCEAAEILTGEHCQPPTERAPRASDGIADPTPSLFVPRDDSDVDGHGTHVAGIVTAEGDTDPDVQGAAPKAKLCGFDYGPQNRQSFVVASYDWIPQHHDEVDPTIEIVTHSWGIVNDYDYSTPDPVGELVRKLVDERMTVVFAAGNAEGDGDQDQTNPLANHPSPGVVGVANYDDNDTGTRNGELDSTSSRGDANDPSTWPDLSAPGTGILASADPTRSSVLALHDLETTRATMNTPTDAIGPKTRAPPLVVRLGRPVHDRRGALGLGTRSIPGHPTGCRLTRPSLPFRAGTAGQRPRVDPRRRARAHPTA